MLAHRGKVSLSKNPRMSEKFISLAPYKEKIMRVAIIVLLMIVCVLLVLCYALVVMAHEADERAERMYRAWKESKDGRFDKTE